MAAAADGWVGPRQVLGRGLDVNVKFDDTAAFECAPGTARPVGNRTAGRLRTRRARGARWRRYTRELACFDVFSVPLRHGWLADPQQAELHALLRGRSGPRPTPAHGHTARAWRGPVRPRWRAAGRAAGRAAQVLRPAAGAAHRGVLDPQARRTA